MKNKFNVHLFAAIVLGFIQIEALAMETLDNPKALRYSKPHKDFINHKDHHKRITFEQKQGLAIKGYTILKEISNNNELNNIKNELYYFEDRGRRFVKDNYIAPTKTPSIKSAYNLFYGKSEQEELMTQERQKALESVISVIWALADYAAQTDQLFVSGSFSIIDPYQYLFDFFSSYITFLGDGRQKLNDLTAGVYNPISFSGSSFMYSREPGTYSSSHYLYENIKQFGIDARFEGTGSAYPAFPYRATHIMVGRVKNPLGNEKTFIKFEPFGTGDLTSWAMHTVEYCSSLYYKSNKRSEKIVPTEVVDNFIKLIKSINATKQNWNTKGYPRIIAKIIAKKSALANQSTLKDSLNKDYDIATFAKFAFYLKENALDENTIILSNEFIQGLQNLYMDYEKVFYRTGNEVVLDLGELVPSVDYELHKEKELKTKLNQLCSSKEEKILLFLKCVSPEIQENQEEKLKLILNILENKNITNK